jgi:hypothetical protein
VLAPSRTATRRDAARRRAKWRLRWRGSQAFIDFCSFGDLHILRQRHSLTHVTHSPMIGWAHRTSDGGPAGENTSQLLSAEISEACRGQIPRLEWLEGGGWHYIQPPPNLPGWNHLEKPTDCSPWCPNLITYCVH